MEKRKNTIQGFTLIELLVVIAIIGILSALLMANFIGIRQRARDGQRKSDLRQIQSALELYRADVGAYPTDIATSLALDCGDPISSGETVYMKKIPCDPINTPPSYKYQYTTTGTNYCLRACLENANDPQKDPNNNVVDGCNFLNSFNTYCDPNAAYSFTVENP